MRPYADMAETSWCMCGHENFIPSKFHQKKIKLIMGQKYICSYYGEVPRILIFWRNLSFIPPVELKKIIFFNKCIPWQFVLIYTHTIRCLLNVFEDTCILYYIHLLLPCFSHTLSLNTPVYLILDCILIDDLHLEWRMPASEIRWKTQRYVCETRMPPAAKKTKLAIFSIKVKVTRSLTLV